MKIPLAFFLLLLLCGTILPPVQGQNAPPPTLFPHPGLDWTSKGQATLSGKQYEAAWSTFINDKTGDIMAFAMDRYVGSERKAGDGATMQSSSDMFPGGYPRFARKDFWPTGWDIHCVRMQVISLGTGVSEGRPNREFKVLEFTYIFEDETGKSPKRIGHGYGIPNGDIIYWVQNTSTHVITHEDAQGMAVALLQDLR
jgi:hypothetical protein